MSVDDVALLAEFLDILRCDVFCPVMTTDKDVFQIFAHGYLFVSIIIAQEKETGTSPYEILVMIVLDDFACPGFFEDFLHVLYHWDTWVGRGALVFICKI